MIRPTCIQTAQRRSSHVIGWNEPTATDTTDKKSLVECARDVQLSCDCNIGFVVVVTLN